MNECNDPDHGAINAERSESRGLRKAWIELDDKRQQLERELIAVTEQRDQWKDKYIQQNKDLGHELRDPNGTIWSECKRLQTDLDAVTKQRDGLRSGIDYASDQLHTVTEQRDRLAAALWNMLNQEHGSAVKAGILLRSLNLQYLNPNAEVDHGCKPLISPPC
jgi:DNA repair exonuclease SbcCD ATPase subunit